MISINITDEYVEPVTNLLATYTNGSIYYTSLSEFINRTKVEICLEDPIDSKEVEDMDDDLFKDIGLDSGLHPCVVCYIKYRIFEDIGDMQKAMYFRKMFTDMFNKYPLRKSGIRRISVPRM